MNIEYDAQADAVYIQLSDKLYAYGRDLDDSRRIDYSEDGKPIGIELLNVSDGVNASDLPIPDEVIQALIERYGITPYFEIKEYTSLEVLEESVSAITVWFGPPMESEQQGDGEVVTECR